jgi:hypothetical protein
MRIHVNSKPKSPKPKVKPVGQRKHKPVPYGISPTGYICYCRNCGKCFGSYKDVANSSCASSVEQVPTKRACSKCYTPTIAPQLCAKCCERDE